MKRMAYLLIACLYLGGCGFTAPARDAGFADVDSLDWRQTDQTMALSLGPTVLSMAAAMVEDDPKTQQILRSLDGVRVKIYKVEPGEAEAVSADMTAMQQALQAQAWEPVVLVQEPGESTFLLVKMEEEEIRGITVLNTDGMEAVFVNIMGDLQPEMFTQAIAALNVPAPEIEIAPASSAEQPGLSPGDHPGEDG